jgi:hypothetical protein
MSRPKPWFGAVCAVVIAAACQAVHGEIDVEQPPSWAVPDASATRGRIVAWIEGHPNKDDQARAKARAPWNQPAEKSAPPDLLDAAMESIAALDPRGAKLRDDPLADPAWLFEPSPPPDATAAFARETVRLWLGRARVRQQRFDEAVPLLDGLDVRTAIDPAGLLFHRAACRAWLLESDAALEDLDRLLERSGGIPVRYERMARLLRADMAALEDESLDHIARRMRDITRRLDLGHAGPKTRSVQDGVIASLDKLIKRIEDQQSQSSSQGSGGGSGAGGSGGTPMDDSRIAGGKGPGEARSRDIGSSDGWGNLPPHEREEALQQIGREFPAHYREAIEQYFKRLATGNAER